MGLKDWIANAFSKSRDNKSRYKEIETEYKLHKTLEERQKNSDERELERFHEEARQRRIKGELAQFRKRQQKEFWNGRNKVYEQRPLFRGHKNLMKQRNIFK